MRILYRASLFLFLSGLIFLPGCKSGGDPEPEPTEEERVTKLLTASQWAPSTGNWVVVDGVSVAELFTDFKITFTSTGYTTTGTTPVWPRTGTWKFKTGSTKIFVRDADQVEVTIETLDDKNLKLTLLWDKETTEPGRSSSIRGKHEFNLTK
jgi:hypothetical protein